jgi:2-dehydro-3-deoxygluconokinase
MLVMNLDVITFGEPMVMFYAKETGPLHEVTSFTKALAGAESNVATGLSRLGLKVGLVTKLGKDSLGDFIIKALTKENINLDNVVVSSEFGTGILLKSRVEDGDPEVEYFRKNSAACKLSIQNFNKDYFRSAKHMHVTGISATLSKDCCDFTVYAMNFMKKVGKTISFDPNLRPSLWGNEDTMVKTINELARKSDWFLPGLKEGKLLTGHSSPEEIGDFYINQGVKLVVIKLGADGSYYKTLNNDGYIKGFPVENVVDTVGAGDGFAVGVISALLEEKSIENALNRANIIGALAVMSPGDMDGFPVRSELEKIELEMALEGE